MNATEHKSDVGRAFAEDGELKTHVGGQALIEGIMMRGKYNWAVAVREPDGSIYLEEHAFENTPDKKSWLSWPFIRGCRAFVESLVLGYKAISIAAEHAFAEDEAEEGSATTQAAGAQVGDAKDEAEEGVINEPVVEETNAAAESDGTVEAAEKGSAFAGKEITISLVLGLVLGIVLFIVAPAFLTNLIVGDYDTHTLVWNIVDGILRIAIFIFYIWLIGRMSDIKRMFGYHGAEHKTIHCFEHQLDLTPENARSFPRLHVRCGTAFLIMVMILAIFIYTVIPLNELIGAIGITNGALKLALVIAVRILLLPIIAGIAYEITVKWAGSHPNNPLVKIILWPGLQMQKLTTHEPEDDQIECAIAAMKLVLQREQELEATQ